MDPTFIFDAHPYLYYNWTMSHHRDSNVYLGIPYGAIKRWKNSGIVNQMSSKQKCFQLVNRKQLIAFFDSRSSTKNQREDNIKQLIDFITLNVYGKCCTLKCLLNNSAPTPLCETHLLTNYKIYFVVEDSTCPDYHYGGVLPRHDERHRSCCGL